MESEGEPVVASLLSLPDELLASILDVLPLNVLARISLSSPVWRKKVWNVAPRIDMTGYPYHLSKIEPLRLSILDHPAEEETPRDVPPLAGLRTLVLIPENLRHRADDVLRELPTLFGSTLRDLALPGVKAAVSDGSFRNFFMLTGLRRLDLTGVDSITSDGLGHIGRMMSLRDLLLAHCGKIKWLTTLAPLAAEGQHLRRLELNLPGLRWDDMKENEKPFTIGSFTRLRHLVLSGSSTLTDPAFRPISKLTNLTEIVLKDIEKVSPEALADVVKPLVKLRVFHCRGTSMISDTSVQSLISNCTKLRCLTVFNVRRLSNAAFKDCSSLSRLQRLVVSNCALLSDEFMQFIATNTHLRHLNVTRTRVSDAGVAICASFPELQELILMQCSSVTDIGLAHLTSLTELTHLTISGCSAITDATLHNVGKLTALQSLYLTRCSLITDEGMKALQPLLSLTELAAGYCPQVTDVGLEGLTSLQYLNMLYLTGCPKISAEMKSKFKVSSNEDPSSAASTPRGAPVQRRSLQFPLSK